MSKPSSAKTIKLLALAVVASLSLVGAGRAFAGDQDFTVHNATGVEITKLYVAPHSSKDWEEDILGKDTLPDGESQEITFSPKEKTEEWDLKIEDKDGNAVEWENLKLTEITDITLKLKKDGTAYAETKNGDE